MTGISSMLAEVGFVVVVCCCFGGYSPVSMLVCGTARVPAAAVPSYVCLSRYALTDSGISARLRRRTRFLLRFINFYYHLLLIISVNGTARTRRRTVATQPE